MKKTKITYWIFTGLLVILMGMSGIQNAMSTSSSIELMVNHLKYPVYIVPFLGVAKLLGVIGILLPGYPRLKEWAYAGLTFDLTGAMYSFIAIGDSPAQWMPLFIGFILIAGSYIFYHKKSKAILPGFAN